jgi:hypothetical protein
MLLRRGAPPRFGRGQDRAICLCRERQQIAGGGPNFAMTVDANGFAYTQGAPRVFARSDLEAPAWREFCGTCGTHITTRSPRSPDLVVKVGSLDDPAVYGMPTVAVYTSESQPYHCVPEGVAQFEKFPQRA